MLVILNQYHECLKIFAKKKIVNIGINDFWSLEDQQTGKQVSIPDLFGE